MRAALSAVLRAALKKRDVRALAAAARGAGPAALAREWTRLPPLARVAAFRALGAKEAAELFKALPEDGRWLAYLGGATEGAAPLLEGARASERALLSRPSARELAAMRKALA